MFCNQLQGRYECDDVQGLMPPHCHIYKHLHCPNYEKSEMITANPYILNLCPVPTQGQSFYIIKEIPLKVFEEGLTVPSFCVSVLFYSLEFEARSSRGGKVLTIPHRGSGGMQVVTVVTGTHVVMEEEEVTVADIQVVVVVVNQAIMVVQGTHMAIF
jgi:hypothetical protein